MNSTLEPEAAEDDAVFVMPAAANEGRPASWEPEYRPLIVDIALCKPVRQSAVDRLLRISGRSIAQLDLDRARVVARLEALAVLHMPRQWLHAGRMAEIETELKTLAETVPAATPKYKSELERLQGEWSRLRELQREYSRRMRQRKSEAKALLLGPDAIKGPADHQQLKASHDALQARRLQLLKQLFELDVDGAKVTIKANEFTLANRQGSDRDPFVERLHKSTGDAREALRKAEQLQAEAAAILDQQRSLVAEHYRQAKAPWQLDRFELSELPPRVKK